MLGNLFGRFKKGLEKTSTGLGGGLKRIFGGGKIDDATCEELEDLLIMADMGVTTAAALADDLRATRFENETTEADIRRWLAGRIEARLQPAEQPLTLPVPAEGPAVLLMVGVNGSGKTTTIGKLAAQYKQAGKTVWLAAGDTFRAAAVEQLAAWAGRAGVNIVTPHKDGADPAGLVYGAYEQAKEAGADILICDTAGRLQNRKDLMEQLAKMRRALQKHDPAAPHATVLVLDATVGQNAHSQVAAFKEISGVTGLIVTKLDASAKGGVVVGLADTFGLPVHYVGIGEKIEDLRPFNAAAYAAALVDAKEQDA